MSQWTSTPAPGTAGLAAWSAQDHLPFWAVPRVGTRTGAADAAQHAELRWPRLAAAFGVVTTALVSASSRGHRSRLLCWQSPAVSVPGRGQGNGVDSGRRKEPQPPCPWGESRGSCSGLCLGGSVLQGCLKAGRGAASPGRDAEQNKEEGGLHSPFVADLPGTQFRGCQGGEKGLDRPTKRAGISATRKKDSLPPGSWTVLEAQTTVSTRHFPSGEPNMFVPGSELAQCELPTGTGTLSPLTFQTGLAPFKVSKNLPWPVWLSG